LGRSFLFATGFAGGDLQCLWEGLCAGCDDDVDEGSLVDEKRLPDFHWAVCVRNFFVIVAWNQLDHQPTKTRPLLLP